VTASASPDVLALDVVGLGAPIIVVMTLLVLGNPGISRVNRIHVGHFFFLLGLFQSEFSPS
jgi:hypothetical protein